MKTLTLMQKFNPEYMGPEITPDVPKHIYEVTQVQNSTTPGIRENMSEAQVKLYCGDDDWKVTIK